jgi:hypothetical protein
MWKKIKENRYLIEGIFWTIFAAILLICIIVDICLGNWMALAICVLGLACDTTNAILAFMNWKDFCNHIKLSISKE